MPGSAQEQAIRIVEEHWIRFLFPVLVAAILGMLSLGCFVLAGLAAYHTPWLSQLSFLLGLGLCLFTHHWFFIMLLSESLSKLIITNHRVIRFHEMLFVRQEMMEVSFQKMKTVEARKKGILQNILQYGSLHFESGISLPLIPHPNSVAKDIEQAMGMR